MILDADKLTHTHVGTDNNYTVLVGRLTVGVTSLGLVQASSLGWYLPGDSLTARTFISLVVKWG